MIAMVERRIVAGSAEAESEMWPQEGVRLAEKNRLTEVFGCKREKRCAKTKATFGNAIESKLA